MLLANTHQPARETQRCRITHCSVPTATPATAMLAGSTSARITPFEGERRLKLRDSLGRASQLRVHCAERIARLEARPEFRASVPNGVMFELKRLFFDTALSANRFAFSALLKLVAPEQVLFGSDSTMIATIKGLSELGLTADVLQAIERTNAQRLLKG